MHTYISVHCDVKERLCHSTPSGGYGVTAVASSPVSIAGETMPSCWKRSTATVQTGGMKRHRTSALPHQQYL